MSRDLVKMASLQRREIVALGKQLQHCLMSGDGYQLKAIIVKILSCANKGDDLEPILPDVVKLLAHPDLLVKKVAGEVLAQFSHDSTEAVLLAINTLVQDAEDSSPMVRGQAIKTLSSLQHDSVAEYLERLITKALKDDNAFVRRAAVTACTKLHLMSPSCLRDTGKVDSLYGKIRDSDPVVVVTTLQVLEEVLREEGGVVVNRPIAHHLLAHLKDFPAWCLPQVLSVLAKYSPGDEDEVFNVMNVLDECLTHSSPAVNITCLRLFQRLLTNHPNLQQEVLKRSQAALVGHLSSGNAEQTYQVMRVIAEASDNALLNFGDSYQSFFCHNRDPVYLKLQKIDLLIRLITEETGASIVEELGRYCNNKSQEVSLAAIKAVSLTWKKFPHSELSALCLQQLEKLMDSSFQVLSNLIHVTQDMDIRDESFWDRLLTPVLFNFSALSDAESKAGALYVIGEHMRDSPRALYTIEQCVEEFAELQDRDVKLQLLDTTVKMFLHHPFELQLVLGALLEMAVTDSDLEVKGRANFLYRLLESGVDNAKTVLFSSLSLG